MARACLDAISIEESVEEVGPQIQRSPLKWLCLWNTWHSSSGLDHPDPVGLNLLQCRWNHRGYRGWHKHLLRLCAANNSKETKQYGWKGSQNLCHSRRLVPVSRNPLPVNHVKGGESHCLLNASSQRIRSSTFVTLSVFRGRQRSPWPTFFQK